MAYTALRPEEAEEYFDDEETIQRHAMALAALLKEARHAVVFTGAGVSTLCGIPDFRGPNGVWTLAAAGEVRKEAVTHAIKAIPSFTHMAIVELIKRGIVKFVISQNCDGLHRKSGVPPQNIAELHGNRNLEKCSKCGKEYMRDYDAVASYIFSVSDHRTARNCVICGGQLLDSIINFGDNLPEKPLLDAWTNTKQSDLMIVIGSSLTVAPACHMPQHVGKDKKGSLVICNLQKTPLDDLAKIRIHSKSDDIMKLVMSQLGISVPSFELTRYLGVNVDVTKSAIHLFGVDVDGTPATFFPEIYVNQKKLDAEPFVTEFSEQKQDLEIELVFYGHYNEPNLKLNVACDYNHITYFEMKYNPLTGIWKTTNKGNTTTCFGPTYIHPPFPTDGVKAKSTATGFSVYPSENCPHFQKEVFLGTSAMIKPAFEHNKCVSCEDSSENWICLTCGQTLCSRYVNGHAKLHSEQTGHHIALSFSDLSVWCYECGEYIKDKLLTTMFVGELYKSKFK